MTRLTPEMSFARPEEGFTQFVRLASHIGIGPFTMIHKEIALEDGLCDPATSEDHTPVVDDGGRAVQRPDGIHLPNYFTSSTKMRAKVEVPVEKRVEAVRAARLLSAQIIANITNQQVIVEFLGGTIVVKPE